MEGGGGGEFGIGYDRGMLVQKGNGWLVVYGEVRNACIERR